MARYYPDRAQRLEKTGSAVISCKVTAKGTLSSCNVLSEDPSGYGFGDAAVKLAIAGFQMKPQTQDGTPVEGGTWTTKISFRLADE